MNGWICTYPISKRTQKQRTGSPPGMSTHKETWMVMRGGSLPGSLMSCWIMAFTVLMLNREGWSATRWLKEKATRDEPKQIYAQTASAAYQASKGQMLLDIP